MSRRLIDSFELYKKLCMIKDEYGCLMRIPDVDCDGFYIDIHIKDVKEAIKNAPIIDMENQKTQWKNSSIDPPKEKDASKYGMVIVWCRGAEEASKARWDLVASMPECYQFWMPMPEPPEEMKYEAD